MTGREFDRFFIAIFRPDLLALVDSLPPPEEKRPDGDGAPKHAKPSPKAKPRGDQTRYRFQSAEGAEFIWTRQEFAQAVPEVNPGSLHDIVKVRSRTAKGWRCLGLVPS
ncbi:hypothetical protein [Aeromonas caviae]|uniref:hypothetical protein n=1 Tax=Aeromonas caviae TaxID=648 RepID=UPI001FC8767A|nr:hypothetical protein [Aeromonas caviae]GKR19057.1 hypothetical protein KAM467_21010 [Aeromonas caviae]